MIIFIYKWNIIFDYHDNKISNYKIFLKLFNNIFIIYYLKYIFKDFIKKYG